MINPPIPPAVVASNPERVWLRPGDWATDPKWAEYGFTEYVRVSPELKALMEAAKDRAITGRATVDAVRSGNRLDDAALAFARAHQEDKG